MGQIRVLPKTKPSYSQKAPIVSLNVAVRAHGTILFQTEPPDGLGQFYEELTFRGSSLIMGRGSYKMGKVQVRNLLRPLKAQ